MNSDSQSAIQQRYMLARAWHSKGSLAAAIAGYREVLALDPAHLEASVLLGAMMQAQLRMDEAIQIYRQALEYHPNEAGLHKRLVNVMLAHEGPGEVFRYYGLVREDKKLLSLRPAEILCCFVLRNELARLPYFLEYYRKKGVRAFLAVDNASSDGSFEYLIKQPDVYLWRSELSFNRANFGAGWFEPILRMHGRDHWCLIVDADELLYYPECERRSLADLCRRLDLNGKRALKAIHLDMYSDRPVRDTHYAPGTPFEELCPYFDRDYYHRCDDNAGPFHNQTAYFGGVRRRIFGEDFRNYLSKVPLLKYDRDCILAGGQHWTNLPVERIAIETGALLHFKFFSSFPGYVSQEVIRKEHQGDAMQYQEYDRGLRQQPSMILFDSVHSIRLEDSRQLVGLGVMQAEESAAAEVVFPKIEAVPSGTPRPFWSVMLTVYRRTQYLAQALRSVLVQAPGPEEMQIEVVIEGQDTSIQTEIEAAVRSIAGDRVTLYRQADRAGHPEIFNVCVRRARGIWVHLLHDDDWVAPGFYETLSRGIVQSADVGAAFCRHTVVDEERRAVRLSLLERETPGILDRWLERIGGCCRLQTPSIVVKRDAYERLGGYCPQAKSAFDWEMWQRLAVHYPVWYEPRPLAFFRLGKESESTRLKALGEQIADTRAVIEIARGYVPGGMAETLSRRAGDYYALFAFELARKEMEAGDLRAALLNLREGIQCGQSEEVVQQLISLLTNALQADQRLLPENGSML
jgi:glycosyltransferase involved in cell wall biosynthesis